MEGETDYKRKPKGEVGISLEGGKVKKGEKGRYVHGGLG